MKKGEYLKQYKLTGRNSELLLTFEGGSLTNMEIIRIEPGEWDSYLKNAIPLTLMRLGKYEEQENELFRFHEIGIPALNEKLAMFCKAYELYMGVKYKATKADANNLRSLEISPQLLKTFFEGDFWPNDKTIANYVKSYNTIRTKSARGAQPQAGTNRPANLAEELFKKRYGG